MTPEQVEAKLIELKHRKPFAPYVCLMNDGEAIQILQPGLAINGGGAGFIGEDGGLVDIDFKQVSAIHLLTIGDVA